MFFANFWAWLQTQLTTYVSSNTAQIASAIEPAAVTLATIYVMLWGYLSLTGKIQEPITEGFKRILVIAIILGIGIRLWLYNSLVVDTFVDSPAQLAGMIVGASSPINTADQIWSSGGTIAGRLWNQGGVFNGDVGFYIAGAIVYIVTGVLAVYTVYLVMLSKVALSIIFALGPIFIVLLFFDATKRFFESWIAQLANYALITILAALVSALFLNLVQHQAAQVEALGAGVTFPDTLYLLLTAGLVLLTLKQVPSIAAGLASGIALSSFNAVSSAIRWGMRGTGNVVGKSLYDSLRGGMDAKRGDAPSRYDSLRRTFANRVASRFVGPNRGGRGGTVSRDRVMPVRPR